MSSVLSSLVRLFVVIEEKPAARAPAPALPDARLARALASVLLDVARQDGRIDAGELQTALEVLQAQLALPQERRRQLEQLLREVADRGLPPRQACETIAAALPEEARMALLQGLYALVSVDGERTRAERVRVRQLAQLLGLSPAARATAIVRALGSTALCYELLEVSPSASDAQLEAAYRRRAQEVSDPEEQGQLRTAWETLRQLRG